MKNQYAVKGWAVVMVDGFFPSIETKKLGEFYAVQMKKKDAVAMANAVNGKNKTKVWRVVSCEISYEI